MGWVIVLLSISYMATMPLKMFSQYSIRCGNDNKGLQLKDNGNIQIGSGITQVNIGNSYSNNPYYLSSYIGFNVQRNSQGQWLFTSDGANNGDSAFISDVAGNLRIVTYRPEDGTTTATLSESELIANTKMLITSNGNVGIGTNQADYKLDVAGVVRACEVIVNTHWCDYVFDDNYNLLPISELERYVKENKHLPGIATDNTIENNGLELAKMNQKLMEKIEEMTLYIVQLNNRIAELENRTK